MEMEDGERVDKSGWKERGGKLRRKERNGGSFGERMRHLNGCDC